MALRFARMVLRPCGPTHADRSWLFLDRRWINYFNLIFLGPLSCQQICLTPPHPMDEQVELVEPAVATQRGANVRKDGAKLVKHPTLVLNGKSVSLENFLEQDRRNNQPYFVPTTVNLRYVYEIQH